MQLQFSYDKKKVLQGLRYHFIWQPELRVLLVVILAFDAATAILYFWGKIRPQPFLLGSCIWLLFLVSFWYLMPNTLYKRNQKTFGDTFLITFKSDYVFLENENGEVQWGWGQFTKFAESPNFFHLYFSPKSFFLVPKDNMVDEFKFDLRLLLSDKIKATV
jgi:YcxB-like protein